MNAVVPNNVWSFTESRPTTAGDELGSHRSTSMPGLAVWMMGGTNARTSFSPRLIDTCLWTSKTTFGWTRLTSVAPSVELLADIRSKTRLTWDQLAKVFGVQRRSLHLWARGSRLSADNAERLERVAAAIRLLDAGDPERTRSEILRPLVGGESVYDLLCSGRDREVLALAGRGPLPREMSANLKARRPPTLSRTVRRARRGLAPAERLAFVGDDESPQHRYLGATALPTEI